MGCYGVIQNYRRYLMTPVDSECTVTAQVSAINRFCHSRSEKFLQIFGLLVPTHLTLCNRFSPGIYHHKTQPPNTNELKVVWASSPDE